MRKRKPRRLISVFLVLSMLLSMLPAAAMASGSSGEGYIELDAAPEYSATVYVSGTSGSASNDGTENAPVDTLAQAYAKLAEQMADATASDIGHIVVLDSVTVSAAPDKAHDYIVHVTGGELAFTANYTHAGPTVYDDITLKNSKESGNLNFNACGPLTIEENVVVQGNVALIGSGVDTEEDTWLLVKSGTWRNLYAGGNGNTLDGNANLKMTGGEVTNLLGGSYDGKVTGNVSMTFTGDAQVKKTLACGDVYKQTDKTVEGNSTVVFSDGARMSGTMYAGYAGTVGGDVKVSFVDGAEMSGMFVATANGGSVGGSITFENKNATMSGSFQNGTISQISYNVEATSTQEPFMTITRTSGATRRVKNFTGGGTLKLGSNVVVIISGAVEGKTDVVFDGTPTVDTPYVTAPASVSADAFTCGVEGYTFASSIDETAGTRTWTLAEKVTYAVQIADDMENGTVTASPTSAAAGETVTLTVAPAEGYELDTLTVEDGTGEEVAVNNNTFTMPASAVTVSASFKALPSSDESATVYVSASGLDTNEGTESAPVATLTQAYAKLAELMTDADADDVGTIIIQDSVTVSAELTGTHDYTVRVTGGALNFGVELYKHLGPTVYDNIALKRVVSDKNVRLVGCGPLTMGQNVTTDNDDSNGFFLVGGSGGEGDTSLLVQSGTWRNIYIGTNADSMTGNASLEMTGGEVTNMLRGTYDGQVNGDVTVLLENGADMSGTFYATDEKVTGTVTLTAKNATLSGLFNGVSAMMLNIEATSNEAPIMTITTTNTSANRKVNNFAGGGTLKLENNVSMTISGEVTGETEIVFDGTPVAGTVYVTAPESVSEDAFTCGVEGYTFTTSVAEGNRIWTLEKEAVSEPDSAVVYVSTSGDDSAAGTEQAPVATLAQAYELLAGAAPDEGKIVLLDTLTFTSDLTLPTHSYPVVISGKTGTEGIASDSNIFFNGPTTLDDLTLTCTTGDLRYIVANGYAFTIGEDVTCASADAYFNLVGGGYKAKHTRGSDLTIKGGRWNNVYAASYNGSSSSNVFSGGAKLTVTGGTITTLTGGSFAGKMTGNSTVVITGGEITGLAANSKGIFACGMYGSFDGNLTLTIAGETADSVVIADTIVGGMRQSTASAKGTVTINISGATLNGGIDPKGAGSFTGTTAVNLSGPLTVNAAVTANTFTGGSGALALGRSGFLTISDSVTGSTSFTVDTPVNGTVYITAPAATEDGAFTYSSSDESAMTISSDETVKTWSAISNNEPVGLTLTVPEAVTLNLYQGVSVSSSKKVTPTQTSTDNGVTSYYYEGLSVGGYCYQVSGDGYYKLKKNVYYSEQDSKNGRVIDANPGLKNGYGFEQSMVSSFNTVKLNSDEFMTDIMGKTWKDQYDALLVSPYFTRKAELKSQDGIHMQTTHEEMLTFLNELDDDDDNMYLYTIGTSPKYDYDYVVAIFTQEDLSGAATLEAAAEILNANEKPDLQYQAQIHSTEPAATEGALVMAKELDGAYGNDSETGVLNTIDVVMIPRINADGAYEWRRTSATTGDDMNRDYLYMSNEEVRMTTSVYNLFLPEVLIDAHEYTDQTTSTSGSVDDIQMTGNGGGLNNPKELTDLAQTIMEAALNRAQSEEFGLRGDTYQGTPYGTRAVVGAGYAAARVGISFLLETRGIHNGMGGIERRVMAQYAAASTIITYTAEHPAEVMETVADSRAEVAANGATYEEDDLVVLDHVTGTTKTWAAKTYNFLTGEKTGDTTTTWNYADAIGRSRVRPTAYVIPKNLETADEIVEVLSRHTIQYYELAAGASVKLQQYMGNDTVATLTEEQVVTFEEGAYVFPMNQVTATVLAVIMEPDVDDSADTESTLLRMGLVKADSNGYLPIYRYCYDLVDGKITVIEPEDAPEGLDVINPTTELGTGAITGLNPEKVYEYRLEGSSEYIAVQTGAESITGLEVGTYLVRTVGSNDLPSEACELTITNQHITNYIVYVDGVNGSGDNSGRTEDAPLATLEQAYDLLERLVTNSNAPVDVEGKIVLVDTVTLTGTTNLPTHSYPVVISGKTGSVGISSKYNISIHGPTTLENMLVECTSATGDSGLRYIAAYGNKLVLGEGLTCTAVNGAYFNVAGGARNENFEGTTDLTIMSGYWNNVYAASYNSGDYTGNVHDGDTKLTVTGGTIVTLTGGMFRGTMKGDAEILITGGEITGLASSNKGIYAGGIRGPLNGSVTLTIRGEAVDSVKITDSIYGGIRQGDYSVTGDVTINVSGATVGGIITADGKSGTVSGTKTVNLAAPLSLSKDVTANTFDGGQQGELVLNGAILTVTDRVSGSAVVAEMDGASADETVIYMITPTDSASDAFSYAGTNLIFNSKEDNGTKKWYLTTPVVVTFQSQGAEYASEKIAAGSTVTAPADPVRTGYTFGGWYADANCTQAYDFTDAVTEDITLYAKWTQNAAPAPSPSDPDPDDYYYEPTYRIEVDGKVEDGSISVSPKYAEKGDTVSVTVTPDEGYELDELIVTDRKGNELSVTYKNGKYTFKMPAGKVVVTATFVPAEEIPFTDVDVDDWYYDAVKYVYVNDIMAGMGGNKFAPNAELLRSMVAQVLYNLDENRYVAVSALFSDVVVGEWYVEAINWAVAEGIFAGYGNGTFGTLDSVTREQLAMILYNYAVSKGYAISGSTTLGMYADADMISDWAVGAMEWAVANGILRATDGLLTPNVPASRAEVAYAMMQFCELF